jgi:hypothetical protein
MLIRMNVYSAARCTYKLSDACPWYISPNLEWRAIMNQAAVATRYPSHGVQRTTISRVLRPKAATTSLASGIAGHGTDEKVAMPRRPGTNAAAYNGNIVCSVFSGNAGIPCSPDASSSYAETWRCKQQWPWMLIRGQEHCPKRPSPGQLWCVPDAMQSCIK